MKNVAHHLHRVHTHLRCHHKKYLLGIFWTFAVVKMFLLFITWLGTLPYFSSTFADNQSGCVMTGQYYTWSYQEWCYSTGWYWTGGVQECQQIATGYWTGGTLDESGNVINQTYVDPIQSCVMTGQYYTWSYQTWCYLTGGYLTGGSLQCLSTGNVDSISSSDGICTSGDIRLLLPLSWSVLSPLFPIQWQYVWPDCLSWTTSLLNIQLLDSNAQWIPFSGYSSSTTWTLLNTALLAGIRNASWALLSGMYHVLGTGLSGESIRLFTGMYTWHYTSLWTWYRIRLVDLQWQSMLVSDPFTIDATLPTLTWLQLSPSQVTSWYLPLWAVLQFSFLASKELSWIDVRVGGFSWTLLQKSGLLYTYSRTLDSWYASWPLAYSISYADLAGNTGITLTGMVPFTYDKDFPTLVSLSFVSSGTLGVSVSFTLSEPSLPTFRYYLSGSQIASWSSTWYATAHNYFFSWVTLGQSYTYRIRPMDVAGNVSTYDGSFWLTSTGVRFSQATRTDIVTTLTGTLANLGLVLKNEIAKFTACKNNLSYTEVPLQIAKNTYILYMPDFKKSYVKKIVDAFSLLVLDKVEKNTELSKPEITDITKKFDDFLIILKLMRDDDNSCKQNLSNYHITQFKRMLSEYNLYFQ